MQISTDIIVQYVFVYEKYNSHFDHTLYQFHIQIS